MNFKRILVLLMALIMTVSACAPAIYALDREELNEENVEQAVADAKLAIEEIVTYVSENYEQAYADGYAYALENGYIDAAIVAVEEAILALDNLNLEGLELDAELKAALEAELDATVATLGEIKSILERDDIDNVEGALIALVTLEDDLYTHLANLGEICSLLGEDAMAVIIPALNEALVALENALSALDNAVVATLEAVKGYIVDALQPYYEKVVEIVDITRDVYNSIVATIVEIRAAVIKIHTIILDTNEAILDAIAKVEATVEKVIDTYVNVVELAVAIYGNVEDAIEVAVDTYEALVEFIVANEENIEQLPVVAEQLYNEIVEIVVEAYGERENAYAAALEIYDLVVDLLLTINNEIYGTLDGAVNGHYVLNKDSYYVALGYADYADALAEMVHLGDKHDKFELNGDYADALAGADLVTIDLSDDTLYDFVSAQIIGSVMTIVRNNATLMSYYNHPNPWIRSVIRGAVDEMGFDINAEPTELDWSEYLDADGKEVLDAFLADVKVQVLDAGVPEVYEFDLGALILSAIAENGISLPGLVLDVVIEIPVADLCVFAVENVLYKNAEAIYNLENTLTNVHALAPEALVVITGFENPVEAIEAELAAFGANVDLESAEPALDAVVKALHVELYTIALAHENTIFVPSYDVETIFAALNFACAHDYDNCDDVVCNLCGGERTAPAHVFENYVANDDATCEKNGTETAVCENCDVTDTREVADTKLPHAWNDATCKAPKTCKDCGATEGDVAEHTYGEGVVVKEATKKEEGVKEFTCTVCGHKLQESIDKLPAKLTPIAIVGIVILVAAVVCGASFGIYWYVKKRNA